VNAGLGFQLQCLLHLLETGGEAGGLEVPIDEAQQFVLLAGEHLKTSRRPAGTNQQLDERSR
jgi:hypothetical protein